MIQYLKCVYREVEWQLYNYEQNKMIVEAAREDMLYGCKKYDMPQYINNVGYISNPVETAVVEFDRKYGKMGKWCDVIERALNILKKEHKNKYMLLIMRYFKGFRKERVIEELNINEKTYHKWKDDIVSLVAMLAIQEGLLKIKT